jgi:DDE superfamily endonuclease
MAADESPIATESRTDPQRCRFALSVEWLLSSPIAQSRRSAPGLGRPSAFRQRTSQMRPLSPLRRGALQRLLDVRRGILGLVQVEFAARDWRCGWMTVHRARVIACTVSPIAILLAAHWRSLRPPALAHRRRSGRGLSEDLWRAVDAEGKVLDVSVQPKRNSRAALKLTRRLLKKYAFVPQWLATDDLRSGRAALDGVGRSTNLAQRRGRTAYRTGHGFARQISAAYSWIVRSLENFPDPAMLWMLMRAHFS